MSASRRHRERIAISLLGARDGHAIRPVGTHAGSSPAAQLQNCEQDSVREAGGVATRSRHASYRRSLSSNGRWLDGYYRDAIHGSGAGQMPMTARTPEGSPRLRRRRLDGSRRLAGSRAPPTSVDVKALGVVEPAERRLGRIIRCPRRPSPTHDARHHLEARADRYWRGCDRRPDRGLAALTQKSRADRRNQWWTRAHWAIEHGWSASHTSGRPRSVLSRVGVPRWRSQRRSFPLVTDRRLGKASPAWLERVARGLPPEATQVAG